MKWKMLKKEELAKPNSPHFSLGIRLELTSKEVALAVVLAVMGFIFSTRQWILFLSGLTPLEGLVVYYIILYGALYVLSKMDLVVFGLKIDDPVKTFGLLLITFAFFVTVNWENPYVQLVTMGTTQGASPVFYGSEDGAVWFVVSQFVSDVWLCRMITFVAVPFLLTILGGILVSGKIKIG